MKTLKSLLMTGALIVSSSIYNSEKANAQFPFIPPSPIEIWQPFEIPASPFELMPAPKRYNIMDEVKGTGWKETSEQVPIGKIPDDSIEDYLQIVRDGWTLKLVDGGIGRIIKVKRYSTYNHDKDRLKIEDDTGSYILSFNEDRTKMSMSLGSKIIHYDRYFPKLEPPPMESIPPPIPIPLIPIPDDAHRSLIQIIRGTKWKEISEQVPIGKIPDDSIGDYIFFGKNLNFEFVDGDKIKTGRMVRCLNPKKDVLQINDGSEWYTLHFNEDRTKMSIVIPEKIIDYEKERL